MAKKIKITADEQQCIDNEEIRLKELMETLDQVRQFKVGDYLIFFSRDYQGGWHQNVNSYGAPIKYVVVGVTNSGFPFMKQTNASGNPVGDLINGLGDQAFDDDFISQGVNGKWELDPDYADSLLLQEEYDPAQLHKNKKQLWKEVTEHNKANKIDTKEIPNIVEFFKTLKSGDMIWTSNVSYYVVQELKIMPKKEALNTIVHRGWGHRIKGPHVLVMTVVDKNQATKDIAADFFFHKALYKQRPRTYKELNL